MPTETYYGFIEEIWELEYRENLKVSLFHCQWIRLPNGVKTDKYGMTNVNSRFLNYREQPFVLAKDVTQVFYVTDPDLGNKEEHHIILQGKKLFELKMLLTRKSTTSLTLCLHSVKISLSLKLMTPRNLRTYVMITTKLSLLDEAI
jgi:hypothetical protein